MSTNLQAVYRFCVANRSVWLDHAHDAG